MQITPPDKRTQYVNAICSLNFFFKLALQREIQSCTSKQSNIGLWRIGTGQGLFASVLNLHQVHQIYNDCLRLHRKVGVVKPDNFQ